MIHQLDINGKDKVDKAIMRLQAYEPEDGYWLAFSGGKDSVVIKALADMAQVNYEAHYSCTSVDPPELVRFIKDEYPDVHFDIPHDKDGNRISMWTLIPKKKQPPTRLARYCCAVLKESSGLGKVTITGVRWAESANRKKNQGGITIADKSSKAKAIIESQSNEFNRTPRGGWTLRLDNTENKKLVDMCYKTHKTLINPIIDWTDEDVWEFIKEYEVPYCKLYNCGYKRLGCIGCPMSTRQAQELERYPKYKALYLKAFDAMLKQYTHPSNWKTAEDVMAWWLQEDGETPKTLITDEMLEE